MGGVTPSTQPPAAESRPSLGRGENAASPLLSALVTMTYFMVVCNQHQITEVAPLRASMGGTGRF
jgi:hypothetical protein